MLLFQPITSKSSRCLPLLMSLVTFPFTTFRESSPEIFINCLEGTVSTILTIPLLPNRLPLSTLSEFSSQLPLSSLDVIGPAIPSLRDNLTTESKIHLIANLLTFTSPRYPTISVASFDSYLQLLAALLYSLPPNSLDPPEAGSPKDDENSWLDSDSESESTSPMASSVHNQVLIPLDPRTRKRLLNLPSGRHVNSLLTTSQHHPTTQASLISFFVALQGNWPAQRVKVLIAVLVHSGGSLVRELYRNYVRSSPIGSDDGTVALMGTIRIFLTRTILLMQTQIPLMRLLGRPSCSSPIYTPNPCSPWVTMSSFLLRQPWQHLAIL